MTALSDAAREALRNARSVAVVTGAGISAESGIPTYRGAGGLYDDPVEGERTMEALSAPTIATDPDRTWRAVGRLAEVAIDAEPNPGHHALARIEKVVDQFVLLTQNVDGLHREAGSQNVIEIHGNIRETTCMSCGDHRPFEVDRYRNLERAPRCRVDGCTGILRPSVVLFGEFLDPDEGARMQRELIEDTPDVVLAVGT
ncbi:MAG: Sir2 family NAD-dependent protein deacetylase, partial [Planctomycetota bacterium]